MKDKYKVELYLEKENGLAESPYYDTRYRVLSWVDIPNGILYLADKGGRIKEVKFDEKISCAIPLKRSNGFLVCGTKALYIYENDKIEVLHDLTKYFDPSQRCNDACVDKLGRLWFSSIVDDDIHAPEGSLYCYYKGEVKCMDSDVKLGNGICWNKKYTRMFFVDSVAGVVYVYDYNLDKGEISNRRVLCNIRDGEPDGMIIDKDEFLWIAIWNGSRIEIRNSKNGLLKRTIDMPTRNITCLAYNAEDKNVIITTAKSDRLGGNLFEVKTDTKFDERNYAEAE